MRVAYLENEPFQAAQVRSWLAAAGHRVLYTDSSDEFLEQLAEHPVDILLLNCQLPDMSGDDLLEAIRHRLNISVPVIFVAYGYYESDLVRALGSGADDYFIKPLHRAELLARLDSLARRAGISRRDAHLALGPIVLDGRAGTVTVNGKRAKLTPKDYQLTYCMLKNVGKLLSRDYLLREVWGIDAPLNTRTVDVHISRIRRSLHIGPEMGYCIRTVYQQGYRLEKIQELAAVR